MTMQSEKKKSSETNAAGQDIQAIVAANEALAAAEELKERTAAPGERIARTAGEKNATAREKQRADAMAADVALAAMAYAQLPQAKEAARLASDKDAAERTRLASVAVRAPSRRDRLAAAAAVATIDRETAVRRKNALMDQIRATQDERERTRLVREFSEANVESELASDAEEAAEHLLEAEEKRLESKECQDAVMPFAFAQKGTSPDFVASHTQKARTAVLDAAGPFLDAVRALNAVYAECNQRIDKLRTLRDLLGRNDALPAYELERDPIELLQAVINNEAK